MISSDGFSVKQAVAYGTTGSIDDLGPVSLVVDDETRGRRVWERSLFFFLRYLAESRASGRLRIFVPAGGALEFGLRAGHVTLTREEGAGQNQLLYEVLKEHHTISITLLDRALAEAEKEHTGLARLLATRRWVKPKDLARGIRETKERRIQRALEVSVGTAVMEHMPQRAAPGDPLPVPLSFLLAVWIREFLSMKFEDTLLGHLEPFMAKYPVVQPEDVRFMRRAGWAERECQVLSGAFNGTLPIDKILTQSGLSRLVAARLVTAMLHLGKAVLLDTSARVETGTSELDRLKERAAAMAGEDYFTRLGLHWTAHPDELRRALLNIERQYGPAAQARVGEAEAEVYREIVRLAREAFEGLNTQEKRQEYRTARFGEAQLERYQKFLVEKAFQTRLRGQYGEALRLLEAAMDLGADTPEVHELHEGLLLEMGLKSA